MAGEWIRKAVAGDKRARDAAHFVSERELAFVGTHVPHVRERHVGDADNSATQKIVHGAFGVAVDRAFIESAAESGAVTTS